MNWIDIEKKLPENKQKIRFKGKFPFECEGFFERSEKGYEFLHLNKEKNKIYHIYGVTHWLPMDI